MSSKTGSSFMTFIVTVPLTIAGMVAVFGVPDLSAVNAASADGIVRNPFGEEGWGGDAARFLQGTTPENAPRFGETNGWGEFEGDANAWGSSSPESNPQQNGENQNPFGNQVAHLDSHQHTPGAEITPRANHNAESRTRPGQRRPDFGHTSMEYDSRNAQPFPTGSTGTNNPSNFPSQPAGTQLGNPGRSMSGSGLNPPSANRYDWHQASRKLSEMGVKNYHLERGTGDGLFLFVCQFTPSDAPHVQHRFEAEANDPLTAVNQVLNQVEGWLNQRFANQSFPSN